MSRPERPARPWLRLLVGGCLLCQAAPAPGLATQGTTAADPGDEVGAAGADALAPGPQSRSPMFLGLQYTFIDQKQTALLSPYQSHLSLLPEGDRQSTNTIGAYGGWAPVPWGQLYLDVEKFMGAGVSGATGIGRLTNGDVVREGTEGTEGTRGYTDGFMLGYISPAWSLRYGMYRMPVVANGQTLEALARAREQDLELTLSPPKPGPFPTSPPTTY